MPAGGHISLVPPEAHEKLRGRFGGALKGARSPLTIKIIAFNLVALSLLVTGILYLNQTREGVIDLRRRTLVADTQVLALSLGRQMEQNRDQSILDPAVSAMLDELAAPINSRARLFTPSGDIISNYDGRPEAFKPVEITPTRRSNSLEDILGQAWDRLSGVFSRDPVPVDPRTIQANTTAIALDAMASGDLRWDITQNTAGQTVIVAAAPLLQNGETAGAVMLSTLNDEIDSYLGGERRQILQVFFLAIITSVSLSLVLAGTIGRPLKELAAAARQGSSQKSRRFNPERVNIPDMSDRPDEIGELSRQMRNMTTALYDRIEANEAFAADVAHEIKNPLTSLRSAVDSMNYAKDDDSRRKLLDVIKNDVQRMDRLVTDISNASRLDAELAKDDMETFDLGDLLRNIIAYQAELAEKQGVTVRPDLPEAPVEISGLANRLAQVFVNLVTNAVSFVPPGGHVTISMRQTGETAEITVTDTGPGIPEDNLKDIFKRFYSSRPKQDFGNNSGLGLAISRQIVEAHGGEIWAENVYRDGEKTGARFYVVLPL